MISFVLEFILTTFILILSVSILWLIVWKLFLVRIPLIREVLELAPLPVTPKNHPAKINRTLS